MKVFAAIDVGSYELAMKIFEISGKGVLKCIDHVRHKIELGTDTYNTGKISQPRVEELCRVLNRFKDIMRSYKVSSYKAYGTSAIRETKNTKIILEQIKLKTGLDVGVLSNSEQRLLHYKAVASRGDKFNEFIKKGCAIVDIGGGSIQISLFDDEKLVTTQNLRLGILRMREMLSDLQPKTNDYAHLIEELCDNHLKPFESLYLKGTKIENIILVDDYISHIMNKIYGNDMLTSEEYKKFGLNFKKNMPTDAAKLLAVPEENISLIMPSALLLRRIIKYTKAERLWAPGVSLADGMAYEFAEREKLIKDQHNFDEDIIAEARNMCLKYQGNVTRNELLERTAVRLFDASRRLHGMGSRERLLLRTVAILNDCGRYISLEAPVHVAVLFQAIYHGCRFRVKNDRGNDRGTGVLSCQK